MIVKSGKTNSSFKLIHSGGSWLAISIVSSKILVIGVALFAFYCSSLLLSIIPLIMDTSEASDDFETTAWWQLLEMSRKSWNYILEE